LRSGSCQYTEKAQWFTGSVHSKIDCASLRFDNKTSLNSGEGLIHPLAPRSESAAAGRRDKDTT